MHSQILHLSDLHLLADPRGQVRGVPTWETFERVLDLVREQYCDCSRIVLTGDIAHDESTETYVRLHARLGELLERCLVVPGNHDDRRSIAEIFGACTPTDDGRIAFDAQTGDWRLIGLDSHVPGETSGCLTDRQLRWLDSVLAREVERPTIVFVHHPPVPIHSPWLDKIRLNQPEHLMDIIARAPQARVVAVGHIHQEFVAQVSGALVVSAPSTAFQFRPRTCRMQIDRLAPGFRVYELDEHALSTYVVRLPEPSLRPRSGDRLF